MINRIKIWEPKYSTNEALIGSHHIVQGENEIVFTKAKALKDKVYVMDSKKIISYPKQSNGKGHVYCVPMADLTLKRED